MSIISPETYPDGRWVPANRVDPACNIANRAYRLRSGRIGFVSAYGNVFSAMDDPITHWYFPPDYSRYAKVPVVPRIPLSIRIALGRV